MATTADSAVQPSFSTFKHDKYRGAVVEVDLALLHRILALIACVGPSTLTCFCFVFD